MGSCNSKEQELSEDLERIQTERVEARQREEQDRVANSKLIRIKFNSPPPGSEIEVDELETGAQQSSCPVVPAGVQRDNFGTRAATGASRAVRRVNVQRAGR